MSGTNSSISESFELTGDLLTRRVVAGSLSSSASLALSVKETEPQLQDVWDGLILRGAEASAAPRSGPPVVVADVFCGAGGLTQGVKEACNSVGLNCQVAFGGDQDSEALAVFSQNHKPSALTSRNVSTLVDYAIDGQANSARFAYQPYLLDDSLAAWENKVTVLVGGPPCQGHSSLNNKTRREDPRNLLYLSVPALAVALNVEGVIIENVPEVRQDKQSVFATAVSLLKAEGYEVETLLMSATSLGVPQTRKRLFLVATKGSKLNLKAAYEACSRQNRSLMFAIEDLQTVQHNDTFRSTSNVDAVSQSRIDYLFAHDLYELPNEMRPDCHKDGHSYPSVYGRLRKDQPSGTITQGFNTIGRGRFIHPTQKRPITPQEAARLQGFPDTYSWNQATGESWPRSTYAKLIGNAVPPRMGFVAMLAILESLHQAK